MAKMWKVEKNWSWENCTQSNDMPPLLRISSQVEPPSLEPKSLTCQFARSLWIHRAKLCSRVERWWGHYSVSLWMWMGESHHALSPEGQESKVIGLQNLVNLCLHLSQENVIDSGFTPFWVQIHAWCLLTGQLWVNWTSLCCNFPICEME